MGVYLTPGVYFERAEARPAPEPLRTDVAGFVGLAERGPLHQPQRVADWREFQQIFGGFLPHAHLAYNVRAFFENGGRACWVVRVADADTARAAWVDIPDESGMPVYRLRAVNPGGWGNALEASLQIEHLGRSQNVILPGLAAGWLALGSMAGFAAGSLVELTQTVGGAVIQTRRFVSKADAVRGLLAFDQPLTGSGLDPTDADHRISLETLEFTLLVWQDGQVAERFPGLSPSASHARDAVLLLNQTSRLVHLERLAGGGFPLMPWRAALSGGLNGLRTLNIYDFIGTPQGDAFGLAALESVDEVGLLLIPDLMALPAPPPPVKRAPPRKVDECALDTPLERTDVTGRVVDAETRLPLAGVEVSDGLHQTGTAFDGTFFLPQMFPGNVDLLFSLAGYSEKVLRVTVLVTFSGTQNLGDIELLPLDLPPRLELEDSYLGQAAMIGQCERLRDRFAILDAPLALDGSQLDVSGLQSWRARFDTAFGALYAPWVVVRDPLSPSAPLGRLVPPGGHAAGVYAATDLAEGVFRAPANRALDWAEDAGTAIDDNLQGVLNPLGINAIRSFPGRGLRIYGARTLSSESAWRFVNVRRLVSMIEEALYDSLQWAVFEPNDTQLWFGLRLAITTFLDGLWRRGAFAGDSREAAFQVRCDATTTPPDLQANGQAVAEVRIAPTVPYEFIILRLGVTADELQISEV